MDDSAVDSLASLQILWDTAASNLICAFQIPVETYFPPTNVGNGVLELLNGEAFDLRQWEWNDRGMQTLEVNEFWALTVGSTLSHFAVVKAETGCDRVPNSPQRFDACGVCGGDNSTCSGCDGIPNTGRDRFCSGHGQCGEGRSDCSCLIDWFDVSCSTFCRKACLRVLGHVHSCNELCGDAACLSAQHRIVVLGAWRLSPSERPALSLRRGL